VPGCVTSGWRLAVPMARWSELAPDRIRDASRPPTPPTGSFLDDAHLLAGVSVAGLYAEDDSDRRLTGRLVRRAARQHDCGGLVCWHRNHRRDAAYLGYLAAMLDVADVPAPTAVDYRLPGMRN
jgi:hypothetical protein